MEEVIRILKPESVEVAVTMISQNPISSPRSLQEETTGNTTSLASNLTIQYDVNFFVRAVVGELDPRRYVGSAFDSRVDRDAFVEALKASGDDNFKNLISMESILEDTTVVVSQERAAAADDDGFGIGVIIAVAGAAVAGASLIGLGVYMVRHRQTQSQAASDQVAGLDFFSVDSDRLAGMVDITGRPDNEVSTLGDPIPQGALSPPMDISLDDTAGQSLPYDYKVASRALYAVDEAGGDGGSPNASRYSEVSSNVDDAVGDIGTLDDPMDNQYLSNQGQEDSYENPSSPE